MSKEPKRPALAHAFKITFDFTGAQAIEAYFKSVSGLSSDIAVEDLQSGGARNAIKMAGSVSYSNITLTRGFSGTSNLLDWHQSWARRAKVGQFTGDTLLKATVTIQQLDSTFRNPVFEWKVKEAWPCKWSGGDFDAEKSEINIETIELAHNGIEFQAVK